MLKLAANLDWLFTDLPIAARFQAAKAAGFHGIEGLFLWQHPLETAAGGATANVSSAGADERSCRQLVSG